MLSEDLFIRSDDSGDSTPERHQREFDRLAWILVEVFGILLGRDDQREAEFYFITYCRKYVKVKENRWHHLREYVHNKESATA